MASPTDDLPSVAGGARRLLVVLWVGEWPGPSTVRALNAERIGVIGARDAAHAAELRRHFKADALLCADDSQIAALSDMAPTILVGTSAPTQPLPAHPVHVSDKTVAALALTIKRVVRTHPDQSTAAA